MHNRRKCAGVARRADDVDFVRATFVFAVQIGKHEQLAASCGHFLHIRLYFVQQAVFRRNHHNRHIFVHQRERSMFQFAGRIGFRMDIGDFLQFQRAFQRNRVMDAAPQKERAGFFGKFLRPCGDLRFQIQCVLNAARKLAQFLRIHRRALVRYLAAQTSQRYRQTEQHHQLRGERFG